MIIDGSPKKFPVKFRNDLYAALLKWFAFFLLPVGSVVCRPKTSLAKALKILQTRMLRNPMVNDFIYYGITFFGTHQRRLLKTTINILGVKWSWETVFNKLSYNRGKNQPANIEDTVPIGLFLLFLYFIMYILYIVEAKYLSLYRKYW